MIGEREDLFVRGNSVIIMDDFTDHLWPCRVKSSHFYNNRNWQSDPPFLVPHHMIDNYPGSNRSRRNMVILKLYSCYCTTDQKRDQKKLQNFMSSMNCMEPPFLNCGWKIFIHTYLSKYNKLLHLWNGHIFKGTDAVSSFTYRPDLDGPLMMERRNWWSAAQ